MKIKTLREYSGVPKDTQGIAERDGKLWKITWDLTTHPNGMPRNKPLVDWFNDDEFNESLVKI